MKLLHRTDIPFALACVITMAASLGHFIFVVFLYFHADDAECECDDAALITSNDSLSFVCCHEYTNTGTQTVPDMNNPCVQNDLLVFANCGDDDEDAYVTEEETEALLLKLHECAIGGCTTACYNLGVLYERLYNLNAAFLYYSIAKDKNHPLAAPSVARLKTPLKK